ncbi:DUF6064 family protein [Parabacteroides pacaensis]|uniref:DUF6064 family protein n=1 Tax=Parabacteroides pacaensis TaxID=2086575 RepID=UPI000D0E7E93|nr:DUF6064 family protein [Parabacteroides pacaensis]
MEIFWNTIAQYNLHTWIYQIIIILIGGILSVLLYQKPTRTVKILMKLFFIFLNGWIAGVYYGIYCESRNYSMVQVLFWGFVAFIWLYDLYVGYTTFERTYKYDKLAIVLCLFPFVYPVISLLRGLSFPMITSPVMPCSVAIFTIGLLLSFSKKVNIFIILFIGQWALLGLSKVYFFQIPEDLLLSVSTFPALYIFFKQYINSNLDKNTKPSPRVLKWLLVIMCGIIAIFFTIILYHEIGDAKNLIL